MVPFTVAHPDRAREVTELLDALASTLPTPDYERFRDDWAGTLAAIAAGYDLHPTDVDEMIADAWEVFAGEA